MSTLPAGMHPPWKPGQSGNPSGRKPLPEWLKGATDELLRIQFQAATKGTLPVVIPSGVKVLADDGTEVADDEAIPGVQLVDDGNRLRAAQALLDRVYGKAPQAIDVGGEGLAPAVAALVALAERKRKP